MTTTTTTITPCESSKSSNGKKKAAAVAAGVAGAAGLGVAAVNMSSGSDISDDGYIDENLMTEEMEGDVQSEIDAAGTASQSSASASEVTNNTIEEPQPIANTDVLDSDVVVEPALEVEPELVESDAMTESESADGVETNTTDGYVNPDDIAEAIIAEEKIDPNDIDMADVINFDEIGTVYTVDGESYTAAAFHDAASNNLVMVDVDGDNVFDVITDYDGNLIAEVPGNISVGDAQEDIDDDDSYLAYDNETDNADEYGEDTIADDLMA